MTALLLPAEAVTAIDDSRWIEVRAGRVFVCGPDAPVDYGLISKPEVWESACEAAGVLCSRLVESDGWVAVELTYEHGTEREPLADLEWANLWAFVPAEMWEMCEEILEGMER